MFKKRYLWFILLGILFISFLWGQFKPMPVGTNVESDYILVNDSDIKFIYDLTNNMGSRQIINQNIFKSVFEIIDEAEEFVVIDMFLFIHDNISGHPVNISVDFTNKLIEKIKTSDVPIYFITDEMNTVYRSVTNPLIVRLEDAGVNIIYTDLNKLRDTNPLISTFSRVFVKPFGLPSKTGGVLPNPFGDGSVSVRSFLRLLDFRANHRKVIMSEKEGLITSANPHTGSGIHSNVGVRVKSSELVKVMLDSEKGVADFSGSVIPVDYVSSNGVGDIKIKYLTENRIEKAIVEELRSANKGDRIDIGMFYISERDIVRELRSAAKRGVIITMVLDANKDAFGKDKNGIPNRQVAYELEKLGVKIRWYKTAGEQFHTKIFIKYYGGNVVVILGSGNYTRRNIGNFNLEADLLVVSSNDSNFSSDISNYWILVLENTIDYDEYEDTSKFKYFLYRFQEWSGLSAF